MKVKELYEILENYHTNGWDDWEIISDAPEGIIIPFCEEQIGENLLAERIIIYND